MRKPSQSDYLRDLEEPRPATRPEQAPKPETKARSSPAPAATARKERVTLYLSRKLWEEARSLVLRLGAEGKEPGSLSALFDAALERELERQRRLLNGGKPFPPFRGGLPGGRPRKSRTA